MSWAHELCSAINSIDPLRASLRIAYLEVILALTDFLKVPLSVALVQEAIILDVTSFCSQSVGSHNLRKF